MGVGFTGKRAEAKNRRGKIREVVSQKLKVRRHLEEPNTSTTNKEKKFSSKKMTCHYDNMAVV